MIFRSPWQNFFFRNLVKLTRVLLRPFGNKEQQFVEKLAKNQNRRVLKYLQKSPVENLLLIMPRCVKKTGCRADVQSGLSVCLECRECILADVALLCARFRVNALVAFRSHTAFEMARNRQPDLIIATACHDRLIKALRAVPEYPALLTPLPPMEKMCINAGVDLVWLEKHLALACGNTQPSPIEVPLTPQTSLLPTPRTAETP